MSDDQKGQNIVEEKPQEPMPSSDKPAEDIKERTANEFEKLTETNKRLKQELDELKSRPQESVLDSLRPKQVAEDYQGLNTTDVKQIQDDLTFIGEDGNKYVNDALLRQRLAEANRQALEAKKQAEMALDQARRYDESAQIREAYKAFPELNPNETEKFDKTFWEDVRKELISQSMQGQRDLMKAASDVRSRIEYYRKQSSDQNKQQQSDEKKQQINATSTTTTGSRSSDHDELVKGTMYGKPGALAERLRRSGY